MEAIPLPEDLNFDQVNKLKRDDTYIINLGSDGIVELIRDEIRSFETQPQQVTQLGRDGIVEVVSSHTNR